jgi:hypothetical protein
MNKTIHLLEDDDYDLNDDLPAELPLEAMTPDVERTRRFRAQALQGMVRLAPDVAEVFDSSEAVNEALRTMIRVMRAENKAA